MMDHLLSLTLYVVLAVSVRGEGVGDYFQTCNYQNAGFDDCVKESITNAREVISNGIPELDFPPFEPYFIKETGYSQGRGRLYFKQNLRDFKFHHLSDYQVKSFKSDFRNLTTIEMNLVVVLPAVHVTTDYEMDGYIMVFPFRGNGDAVVNITKFEWDLTLKGKAVTREDNKRYFQLDKFIMLWDLEKARAQFNNLFDGNRFLGANANRFLNDNFVAVFRTLKHLPEHHFGLILKKDINKIFSRYTFDELFMA